MSNIFPQCPDNHRWWECKHRELEQPFLGVAVMIVGAANMVFASLVITNVVQM